MKNENYLKLNPKFIFRLFSLLLLIGATSINSFAQTQTFSTAGTSNWTAPAGVTSVTIQAWGGGGGGGLASTSANGKGGGGGGAYASGSVTVVPGTSYSVVVGAGGQGGTTSLNATSGGNSTFNSSSIVAVGGAFANNSTSSGAPGAGGLASACTGTVKGSGGTGGTGNISSGGAGGGGGASGTASGAIVNGSNASGSTGGVGGNGADGDGGAGGNSNNSGVDSAQPGGGGGGRGDVGSVSGDGGTGRVILTWTCPSYAITATSGASPVCISAGNSTVTLTGSAASLPVGTYTVTYNRSLPSATGLTASMTVTIAGTGSFTAAGLTTAGSSTITVTSLASGASGGTCSSTISANNTSAITVNAAPTISVQPSSQGICPGLPVTFSVTGNGTPVPTYQWKKAGVDISGATNSSFNIASVSAGDAASYTVVLTNSCSSLTSSGAALTINSAPSISVHPSSQTKCTGTSVTFSVTASGTPAPTYQWRKDGVNISGATTASYNIASVVVGSAAAYDVVVNNTCGNLASNVANLTVNTAPTISVQPSTQAICSGFPVTFSVTGTGTPVPTYQWRKAGVDISSATNSSFNIASVSAGDAASYTVVLANSCSSLTSSGAALTVNSAPAISVNPASQTKCTGTSVTFNATASGTPAPTYQWRKDGVNISGATTASYNIASVVVGSAAAYDVVVTNTCATAASTAAALTVNVTPTADASNNGPICSGNTLNLSSNSTGVTYLWSGPASFSSTLQSPTRPNALTTYSGTYTITVTDIANGCTASITTGATVNATPATSASNNSAICAGSTLTLTGGPSSQTTYSWVGPNGYTSSSQSPSRSNAQTSYSGTYTLTVTSSAGCSASASTAATVNALPVASASNNGPVCQGSNLNLSASGGASYAWTGPNGYSSTSQNPSITGADGGDVGTYTVTVTQTGCTASASTVLSSIKTLPVPAPAVTPGSVCSNSAVSLSSKQDVTVRNVNDFSIPNVNSTGITSQIPISAFSPATLSAATIKSVAFNIDHTQTGDLEITLIAPGGSSILLVNNRGGSGDNFTNTTIVNSGGANGNVSAGSAPFTGTYNTETAFSGLTGNTNGTWGLKVVDNTSSFNSGTLLNWTLTLVSNGVTYNWSSSPAGFSSVLQNPIGNPSQNTTYTVDATLSGCIASGSVGVTTMPIPEPYASSNAPICSTSGLSLFGYNNAAGQVTGNTWSWKNPNNIIFSTSQNPSISNATIANSGNYTLTITNTNGCTASATTQAIVNPNPVLSIGTQSNVSCNGLLDGTVSLIATDGTPSYLYDLEGNLTVNGIYSGLSAGNHLASVTDDNGCQVTSTLNVVITQPAVLSFNSSSINESCLGYANGSVTISAIGGTPAYQYSIDNGFNFQNLNSFTNLSVGNYDLIVKDAHNCITNSALVNVGTTPDVTPPVIINSPVSFSKCNELTPVNWTVPVATDNCTTPVLTSNHNPGEIFPVGVTTIVYTADDGNGNIATSSFNVTVNSLPTVSASDAIGCDGIAIALSGTPIGGTWSVANPYTGPSTTYVYTYTDVNGCTNTSAVANIIVNPLPIVTASDASGCAGTSIGLSGTPTGGIWSVANPYTGPSTTYTYSYTDVNGCTNSNTANITVNPLPIVTASDVSVCIGNSIALSGTPAGGIWSVANPYTGPSTTYTYTFTDVNGCTNTSAVANIIVNALPTAIISNNSTICLGEPAQLHIDFTGTGPWNYIVSDGSQSVSGIALNSSHDFIVIPPTSGEHDYLVTSISDANCNGTFSGTSLIVVNDAPPAQNAIAAITGIPDYACSGDVALITATSSGGLGITYSWNNGSGSNPVTFSNSINGPFVTAPFTTINNQVYVRFGTTCCGMSGYRVVVKAVNGCGNTNNLFGHWVQATVSGPAFINPPTAVTACPNDVKNYTCGSSSGATLYSWTLNGSAAPISSGQGTTNVQVTFPAAFTSGNLCVTAALACGGSSTSPARCMTISKIPATPFPITGTLAICPGATNVSYSIPAVAGATGYNWTVPAGVTITGGQNTPSITVNFPTPYNGAPSICVTALTPCGNSAGRCMSVYSGIPSQPAAISGPLFNICGSTVQYSVVSPVAGLTYTWTNPSGTTLSGQGGSTIQLTVSPTFNTGFLTVVANSALCAPATSAPRSSSGFWGRPNTPGISTANPNLWCSGGYVNFSVAPAAPLPTYTWTVTNGTIDAGQGSNNIDVTWGANVAGTVSVRASNGCGTSAGISSQSFSSACREEGINTSSEVAFSIYPNPAHDNVTLNFNSIEKENVYIDLIDLSGRTVQTVAYDADKGTNKVMIDLKKFSKGAYIVQIKSDKLHQQLPIILQ